MLQTPAESHGGISVQPIESYSLPVVHRPQKIRSYLLNPKPKISVNPASEIPTSEPDLSPEASKTVFPDRLPRLPAGAVPQEPSVQRSRLRGVSGLDSLRMLRASRSV